MPDSVKVAPSALNTLLGLEPTKTVDPTKKPESTAFLSRYSSAEIRARLNQMFVPAQTQQADYSPAGIISYLKPIHKSVGEKRINVDKMRALAPEIEQSKVLVSSAIMSPNDLQDGEFRFGFENIPGIEDDPELVEELNKLYSEHFNKTLSLGIKSYDWIGDIQYSKGAIPILLLPQATVDEIRSRSPEEAAREKELQKKYLFGPGMADFFEVPKHLIRGTDADDYLYSQTKLSWADVLNDTVDPASLIKEMVPSMESFGVPIPTAYREKSENTRHSLQDQNYGDQYLAGMEDMIVNLRKKLAEGDVIRVSENPEIVKFGTQKSLLDKQEVYKRLQEKYRQGVKAYPIEESISLNPNPENFKHHGHPTMIELPVESVIPIFVPGAPSEHLGYFILLDNHGCPLTIENSGLADDGGTKNCSPGDSSAAYETLFGTACTRSFTNKQDINSAGSMVFQNLLDKYIRARIKGVIGRDDVTISRFNAISIVMFQRLMQQKKTVLVYAPPTLLHYLAFSYRPDGTGSTKTEEISFLLSLRTTLMVASIIAMMNDAVDHKKIEIGVDEKEANIEAVMDLVANVFIQRNKTTGSLDPSEIIRDIYSNSLTIVPKNVPGLSDLSVDVQTTNGQTTKPDDSLLEKLTELMVSHLDVPPAALNQMSEPEFARSLTTYNLFFAKKITRYQAIYCSLMTNLVRDYTFFSPPFINAVKKKLQAAGKRRAKDKLPDKVEEMKDNNFNIYERRISAMVDAILSGVELHLAKPNIAVDKSQYEEVRNFMGTLDEMANSLFPQELIPTDDQEAQNGQTVARAKWKKDQLANFLNNIGSFTMVEIPDIDDIDHDEIITNIQVMQNLNKHLTQQRENIGSSQMDENGGGFGGGDSSGFGSDDMSGGGMDDSMGGEDMGSGGMDMDMGGGEDESMSMEEPEAPAEEGGESSGSTAEMYFNFKRKK